MRHRGLTAAGLVALLAGAAHAEPGVVQGVIAGATNPGHVAVWLEGTPPGAPGKELISISQRGQHFVPDFVIVAVGQTVNMPNDDTITHNVFSVSPPKKFDLGHYKHGETRSVRFDKPGIVDVFCNIHEDMHATVVVAPSPFYAMPDADGRFTFTRVPPGSYKVVAYSPEGGTATVAVALGSGAVADVSFRLTKK